MLSAARDRSGSAGDWSWENHQVAHPAPLLDRTGPKHLNAATIPGLRPLDVLDGRGLSRTVHGVHGTRQVDPC